MTTEEVTTASCRKIHKLYQTEGVLHEEWNVARWGQRDSELEHYSYTVQQTLLVNYSSVIGIAGYEKWVAYTRVDIINDGHQLILMFTLKGPFNQSDFIFYFKQITHS